MALISKRRLQVSHLCKALLLGSALSACGFQLKGQYDLAHLPALTMEYNAPVAKNLHQSQAYNRESALRPALEQALQQQGVHLTANAPYRLQLLRYTITPYQSALDGEHGDFYEQTLLAEGHYLLWHPDGSEPRAFTSRYTLHRQYKSSAYLSNDDAQHASEQQLHQETVQQVLHWLRVQTLNHGAGNVSTHRATQESSANILLPEARGLNQQGIFDENPS